MQRRIESQYFTGLAVTLAGILFITVTASAQRTERPPNILWLTCEDMDPALGAYGDDYATTPNLDRFAERSLRYTNAWSTAPVCAPARTTIIAGMYATSLGAQHMRSEVPLPEGFHGFPHYLRENGYYCTNNRKTDYNLSNIGDIWDESSGDAHWKNRTGDQPFLAVFNFTITHESRIRNKTEPPQHDPTTVPVPPYHPDTPEVRRDWALGYDNIETMDTMFGERLAEIEAAGLADDTIVFFYSDHGSGMPRHKRWTYQSGLNVPMIVHIPEKYRHLAPADYEPGGATDRLVGFVDLAATALSLAGVQPPLHFQGHAFMGAYEAPPQPYAFGFRDRMDERYDMTRAVRDARYLYIRNYMPHRPYGQYLEYMFQTPTTVVWKRMFDNGELNQAQAAFWKAKPAEELYDLERDPHNIDNLAGRPKYAEVQQRLRKAQQNHARRIRDLGFLPESEIHSRGEGTTPYDMAHNPDDYALLHILDVAELAASREPTPELARLLDDSDSAVRYWAAMGHLIRGEQAVRDNRERLRNALDDPSASVRIVAAEALGRYGPAEEVDLAVDTLVGLADITQNDLYATVFALNALDQLDERARPQLDAIRELPRNADDVPRRLSSYADRLLTKTLADFNE